MQNPAAFLTARYFNGNVETPGADADLTYLWFMPADAPMPEGISRDQLIEVLDNLVGVIGSSLEDGFADELAEFGAFRPTVFTTDLSSEHQTHRLDAASTPAEVVEEIEAVCIAACPQIVGMALVIETPAETSSYLVITIVAPQAARGSVYPIEIDSGREYLGLASEIETMDGPLVDGLVRALLLGETNRRLQTGELSHLVA